MARFPAPRRTLSWRLTAAFLVLLLLSTGVAVAVIRFMVERDLSEATRSQLLATLNRLDGDLKELRRDASNYAQLFARTNADREADRNTTAIDIALIEQARNQDILIDEFDAWDANVPEVLRRAFSGMPTVDYVADPKAPDRLRLVAAAPAGDNGAERRVVTASMALGRRFLLAQRDALGGDVSVFDRAGMVASSSMCSTCLECIREVLYVDGRWSDLEAGRPLYFIFDCEPESQAVAATPIRTFDGTTAAIVVMRSREGETRALFHATVGIILGSLGFSGAIAFAFFLLVSRITGPLKELTTVAGDIAEGRYGETIAVRSDDEVGDLARAFNKMSLSLQEAMGEISEWNRTLASRVDEKTRELERLHRSMVEVEKLAAMGQLAAGVAHELNNPLSGIMGYSELALDLFRERAPENIAPKEVARMISYFGHIDELSQRCRSIILDMLKFARQHSEEMTDVQVNDMVSQTLVFLSKQLRQGNTVVEPFLEEGIPPVRGNAMQLQQVFTNLILNAAQAMPGGGRLTVSTRKAGEGQAVEVSINDTGTGIAPEHLHRIFEPFFTTKPVGEGTGLGLSVSYGIVKRHGGEIRVESEKGKGSTFTVFLPVTGAAQPAEN